MFLMKMMARLKRTRESDQLKDSFLATLLSRAKSFYRLELRGDYLSVFCAPVSDIPFTWSPDIEMSPGFLFLFTRLAFFFPHC